jgi:hypothetical protein
MARSSHHAIMWLPLRHLVLPWRVKGESFNSGCNALDVAPRPWRVVSRQLLSRVASRVRSIVVLAYSEARWCRIFDTSGLETNQSRR